MRFCLDHVVFSLLCIFAAAAYAEDDIPELQLDRTFMNSPVNKQDKTPIFISAQQIEGKSGNQIEATGEAELRKRGQVISADRMLYLQDSQEVSADGAVRIEQDNNVMWGPHLELDLGNNTGDIKQPEFYLGDNHARGKADNLHLAGRQDYTLRNVSYTTCPADRDDWLLKVSDLEIDRDRQIGTAYHARVEFMGVPILYTPWMDFALNNQRKSGLLSPVFGSTVQGGSEVTLPYYWNLAPNRDATFAPRAMLRRGLLLNNEFRYMEPSYTGEAHLDVLPGDRLTNSTRSLMALTHAQNFGN